MTYRVINGFSYPAQDGRSILMEVMDYDGNPRLRIREMSERGTEREIVIPVSIQSIKEIGELLSTLAMGAYDQF